MVSVLTKWRMVKGWGPRDGGDVVATAKVYLETLERNRVPSEHFDTLYARFVDGRARAMTQGGRVDDLTPEAFVALWIGQNGLAAEIADRRLALPRPDCSECRNTGWVLVGEGRYRGVKKCKCGRMGK